MGKGERSKGGQGGAKEVPRRCQKECHGENNMGRVALKGGMPRWTCSGESQGGQGEGAKGRNAKGDFPGGPKGVMANENDKGDTKWEGQRVRWGHTKRGNAEGSQGGHRGVLSVKLNPFNGLHLSSTYH